jgi:glycerol-3-phosphate dehydrogenase
VGGTSDLADALRREHPFLAPAEALRLARSYGLDARAWLGTAQTQADLGRDFGAGLSEAEIRYLMAHEWAENADDVLWRRSKLGLHMTAAERDAVRRAMDEWSGKGA